MQLAPGLTKRIVMVQQMLHRCAWLTGLAAAMTQPQKCRTKKTISVSPYTSLVECWGWVRKPATSMGLPHHQTWQSMPSSRLQSVTSAAEAHANGRSPTLPIKPAAAALQHAHILHESDATLADSVQMPHTAAPPHAQADAILAKANTSDLASLGGEKPDLPCPEGLPASLLQYDHAWAASVGPFETSIKDVSHATLHHFEQALITQLLSRTLSAVSPLKQSAA